MRDRGDWSSLLDHAESNRELTSSLWTYASAAGLDIKIGILVDPLSVFMILVVSGVSTLIHLYSVAYLDSDRGYARYFAYLNFFVFSMLLLVLAGNFVLLIIGWAFVGFASYALISFWYRREHGDQGGHEGVRDQRDRRRRPGPRDLLHLPRAGDRSTTSTVFSEAPQHFSTNQGVLIAICLLLLVGAFAKSAQLPLHTWLPDAMEGPTPVSALIHAATMVTAGVYLIARMYVLFELAPTAADISAFIGLATLIFAATCALAVTDLKRIIAYSTISQIGYMVVGVSIGAYAAGMFQLMTHAFFKALLFMAAGSVISAMAGTQDIDRMGGLRKAMPFTVDADDHRRPGARRRSRASSGFFSKDEILVFAAHRGGFYWIFTIGGYVGGAADRLLRLPDHLPGLLGRARARGAGARAGPPRPRRAREPADRREGGHRRRLPRRRAPHRRARLADVAGDVRPRRSSRSSAASLEIPGLDDVVENFLARLVPRLAASTSDLPSVAADWEGLAVGGAISIARDRRSPTASTCAGRAPRPR